MLDLEICCWQLAVTILFLVVELDDVLVFCGLVFELVDVLVYPESLKVRM